MVFLLRKWWGVRTGCPERLSLEVFKARSKPDYLSGPFQPKSFCNSMVPSKVSPIWDNFLLTCLLHLMLQIFNSRFKKKKKIPSVRKGGGGREGRNVSAWFHWSDFRLNILCSVCKEALNFQHLITLASCHLFFEFWPFFPTWGYTECLQASQLDHGCFMLTLQET